jgi:hypothetical protein
VAKFDLAKTQVLHELFAVPQERRDDAWREAFFAAAPEASMATSEHQVLEGPDGFPYFALHVPRPATAFDSFCVTHVLDACLEHGFGLLMTADWEHPEWVFHYGDLWGLKETGAFAVRRVIEPDRSKERKVMTGAPSDTLLPPVVRHVIRSWLVAHGVAEPGVLLLHEPDALPVQSLVFSVFPDGFATRAEYDDFMGRLAWFVAPQLDIVGASRDSSIFQDFVPL